MKAPHVLAGLVSAFVTISPAWADGSSASGNILVAPQLHVVTDGPVTATFLGASPSATILGVNGSFGYTVYAIPQNAPTPNRLYPLFSNNPFAIQNPTTPALPAGANVTFAAVFTAFPDGPSGMPLSTHPVSSTGGTSTAEAAFFEPPASNVDFPIAFNAGVIQNGTSGALIGLTPSGSFASDFGSFSVRISVSNVCMG